MFKKWFICTFLIIYSFAFGYSEQVVVSQFDVGLRDTSSTINYNLSGVTRYGGEIQSILPIEKTLGGVDDTAGLDSTLAYSFNKKGDFNGLLYTGATGGKSVIIPVTRNTSSSVVESGSFSLTEITHNSSTNENITNYLIQEKFSLPMKSIALSEVNGQTTGNKFIYTESSAVKKKHLETYKNQIYMIRITRTNSSTEKDTTNYDILTKSNPILEATATGSNSVENAKNFLTGTSNYVDFSFVGDQYDKEQKSESITGISVRFKAGEIYVYGLPEREVGKGYRIELYSFRYSKDISNKGTVVITKESDCNFSVNNFKPETSINLLSFSSKNFSTINATVLVASTTTNPSFEIKEVCNGVTNSALNLVTTNSALTEVYIKPESGSASVPISLDSDGAGTYNGTTLYYKKYEVSYTTPFPIIDSNIRTAYFNLTAGGTDSVNTQYTVNVNVDPITTYPHQTVFATFSSNKNWGAGDYEITDRNMSKYTLGYRGVQTAIASSITNLYKGLYTGNNMSFKNSNYNWIGTGITTNSLIINKAISDSKGTFSGSGGTLPFYTTTWNPGLSYEENTLGTKNDTATFTWTSPNKNTFDATLNEDKVIFRIVKLSTDANGNPTDATKSEDYYVGGVKYTEQLPKCYYKPFDKSDANIIGSNNLNTDLSAFIAGTRNYFDLVFDSGIDSTQTVGNVSFAYSKDNKLIITGLTRAKYLIQIYSLQNEDSDALTDDTYNYRVLTYGGYSQFEMGLPVLVTGGFANRNNVFIINSKSVDSTLVNNTPVKNISLEFTTKSQQAITLSTTGGNFIARNDEETSREKDKLNSKVAEQRNMTGVINSVSNLRVVPAKANFQYPLDIVLCIDNSGSMQNEIDSVTAGIEAFTSALEARGFNVKYNLITFGPPQDSYSIGDNTVFSYGNPVTNYWYNGSSTTNYLAQFKGDGNWFTSTTELTTALGKLNATNGYYQGQENGAWAINSGITYLKDYGRYLDLNNNIVTHSAGVNQAGYVPSQKWIMFLTDENMDTDDLPAGYTSSNVINELAKYASDNNVNLTGIYHTNVIPYSQDSENKYITAIPTATAASYYTGYGNVVYNDSNGYYFLSGWNKYYLYTNSNLNQKVTTLSNATYYYDNGNRYNRAQSINIYKVLNIPSITTATGVIPADTGDRFYTEFALSTSAFNMYEMGADGEYVSTALTHAVNNIGIVQTWKMTYTSPFSETDGLKRESIFSITGLPNVSQYDTTTRTFVTSPLTITPVLRTATDRFYTVPQKKIEALFKKPNTTDREIITTNGKIELMAIAKSEYKEADGKTYNYPIQKGTFVVTGLISGHKLVVSSNDIDDKRVRLTEVQTTDSDATDLTGKWYRATSSINYSDFISRFNNENVRIDFTAETAENTVTITIASAGFSPPKVTQVKLTNNTLATFLGDLKSSATSGTSSTPAFSSTEITSASAITVPSTPSTTGLTDTDMNSIDLNVKDGDSVKVAFRVSDEGTIPTTSTGMTVVYNGGTPIVATYNATSSMWEATINYSINSNTLQIGATDSSGNQISIGGLTFANPALIAPTEIKPRSTVVGSTDYNPAGASYTNYYNNYGSSPGVLPVLDKPSGALAYLAVFQYNPTISDKDTNYSYYYPDRSGIKWLGSSDGNFNFIGDGRYSYAKIYVVNAAGAISNITSNTIKTLPQIIDEISEVSKDKVFYRDTVVPRGLGNMAPAFIFNKRLDANSELNSNSRANGMLNTSLDLVPYKVGDTIELMGRFMDYNYLKVVLSNNIYDSEEPVGTLDLELNLYRKSGIARDLTQGTLAATAAAITASIYDKAGNIYVSPTMNLRYDDRLPGTMTSIGVVTGNVNGVTTKYTSNPNIPLQTATTGAPFSVASTTSSGIVYFGDVHTGVGNLYEFINGANHYPIVPNAKNIFNITTYSHSGVKRITNVDDSIVLDTILNDDITTLTEVSPIRLGNDRYKVNLNKVFSTVKELVGLNKFEILNTSISGVSGLGIEGTTPNGEHLLYGAGYFLNPTASNVTAASNGNYYMTFTTALRGRIDFNIRITDRLGNSKQIMYTVQIPNDVNIIGKKTGSVLEINTKINANGKMKIDSRTER